MNSKYSLGLIFAGLVVLAPPAATAQEASFTIELLATFDYPGTGNSTTGVKVNDQGEVAGFYQDSVGVIRGFMRFRDGSFSAPIVEPNDTGNATHVFGLNNSGDTCGYYVDLLSGTSHGFFLSGGVFSEFDPPGAVNTFLNSLNDAGDFVGAFSTATQDFQAFMNVGGVTTSIPIPGAISSFAETINNGGMVVGFYTDSVPTTHGFIQEATGQLHSPIDVTGAIGTVLESVNEQGGMVGRYTDGSGVLHAFFFKRPNTLVSYDFPGATAISFNGINNRNIITGRYSDAAGIRHGIIVKVNRAAAQ